LGYKNTEAFPSRGLKILKEQYKKMCNYIIAH
jgi:hypothetical protein